MPREIIQALIVLTLIAITPRIIVTIFDWIITNRAAHLRKHRYILEEILQDNTTIDTLKQINYRLENLPNLEKIKQENWELSQIQVKTKILLRKIEKRIKEKEKNIRASFSTKTTSGEQKLNAPTMRVTRTRRIAGRQNHLRGKEAQEQENWVTLLEPTDEQWNKIMAIK